MKPSDATAYQGCNARALKLNKEVKRRISVIILGIDSVPEAMYKK